MGCIRAPVNTQLSRRTTKNTPTITSRTRGSSGAATGFSLLRSGGSSGIGTVPVYTVPQGLQNRRGRDCASATGHVQSGERKDAPGMSPAFLSVGLLDSTRRAYTKERMLWLELAFLLLPVERLGLTQHACIPGTKNSVQFDPG